VYVEVCVNSDFEFPKVQFGEAEHYKLILNMLPPNGLHWGDAKGAAKG